MRYHLSNENELAGEKFISLYLFIYLTRHRPTPLSSQVIIPLRNENMSRGKSKAGKVFNWKGLNKKHIFTLKAYFKYFSIFSKS